MRVHDADEAMAPITAERLVEHLERSGYIVMRTPPMGGHPPSAHGVREAVSIVGRFCLLAGLAAVNTHRQQTTNAGARCIGLGRLHHLIDLADRSTDGDCDLNGIQEVRGSTPWLHHVWAECIEFFGIILPLV
jgi:hypothetical protein